ncbi:MAG: hypothetical protein AAFX93_04860 [Verrucomicrobiota bacterium]
MPKLEAFPGQLLGTLMLSACVGISALNAQESTNPEEVVPVGPGYITKGYKTIINGEVVQTTDGQVVAPSIFGPDPSEATQPATPQSSAPRGNWPEIVTMVDGVLVNPENLAPVNNLPSEVELVPLGFRKLENQDGQLAPFFRVEAKNVPQPESKPVMAPSIFDVVDAYGTERKTVVINEDGVVDESDLEDSQSEELAAEEEEESSGGLFDFLFGSSEEEPELDPSEVTIDLNKPLTEEEVAMLQQTPEFRQYLQDRFGSNRNFAFSSKGRGGGRNSKPELPNKITIQKFDIAKWEEELPPPPTPNMSIGKLVSVDPVRGIAVCWLQTRYIRADRPMITRNYEMQTTGVLLPSGEQEGRSAGFWIADGNPRLGDEVIVPGPEYENFVEPYYE